MRISYLTVALLCCCLAVNSADAASSFDCVGKTLEQRSSHDLLAKVQTSYDRLTTISAKFHQDSYLASLDQAEVSQGKVQFSKPGKMNWHYKYPDEQVFVVKDQTLWLYQPVDNQVTIDNFKDVIISDLPVAFLMGIGDLRRDFKLKSACSGSDGLILDLQPGAPDTAKQSELKGFKLVVRESDFLPLGALVTDVSGNQTAIMLQELELNPAISEKAFATSFGHGVDVIDRREENAHG